MTKTLNHIIFFFLHQNQNIFFSNIGNQNICLEKTHTPPPPLQVKWSFPCIHQISTRVDAYKYSFLPRTIVSWNFLPPELRSQPTVESFRHHIQKIPSLCLDSSETCEQYQLLLTVNRDILIVHTLAIFCCSPTMRWSFNRLVDEFTPYREEEDLLL